MAKIRHMHGKLSQEESDRHKQIRAQVEKDKAQIDERALQKKRQIDQLRNVMAQLKAAREARGMSLAALAERSGIDKGRLSRLENDPHANPTIQTITRIADALGVELEIQVHDAA